MKTNGKRVFKSILLCLSGVDVQSVCTGALGLT